MLKFVECIPTLHIGIIKHKNDFVKQFKFNINWLIKLSKFCITPYTAISAWSQRCFWYNKKNLTLKHMIPKYVNSFTFSKDTSIIIQTTLRQWTP